MVLPLALGWALGFSYELRNLALAVPLAGAAAGVGAAELLERIARLAWPGVSDLQGTVPIFVARSATKGDRSMFSADD